MKRYERGHCSRVTLLRRRGGGGSRNRISRPQRTKSLRDRARRDPVPVRDREVDRQHLARHILLNARVIAWPTIENEWRRARSWEIKGKGSVYLFDEDVPREATTREKAVLREVDQWVLNGSLSMTSGWW